MGRVLSWGTERNCSIRPPDLSVLLGVILAVVQPTQPAVPASTASDPVIREDAMREGMSILMMLSLLTVALVTLMATHCGMRNARRKRAKLQSSPTDLSVDPWIEAGKRLDESATEFDEEV